MSRSSRAVLLCTLFLLPLKAMAADTAGQWWADVSALADDGMEGRMTGTAGYDRAARYVVGRLRAEGLKPAGSKGYLQPVGLEQQVVDQAASRAELLAADGSSIPLSVGDDMLITPGGGTRPAQV